MMLLKMFLAFLGIGAVAFGGGYAVLPLFERIIVDQYEWFTRSELLDMLAVSQVTPGPIAINSATFIGFTLYGVVGAFLATVGVVTVPVVLISVVSVYQQRFKNSKAVQAIFRGLRPALAGLIFASVYTLSGDVMIDQWSYLLFLLFVLLLVKFKVHPIVVILLSAVLGLLIYWP